VKIPSPGPIALLAAGVLVLSSPRVHAQSPAATDSSAADSAIASMPATAPATAPATGPDFPRGKISGYAFGDVFWNAGGDPRHAYSAAGADSGRANLDASGRPITRDLDGVQIRRVYFQLDNDLSIRVSTRFRLEADSRSLTSDGRIGVFVKSAWVLAKSVYPRTDASFGLIDTPTFSTTEELWGYRAVERTLADFRGIASSSDLGVGLRGFADADHRLGYWLVLGNGSGQRPEDNRDKRAYLAVPVHVGDLRLEPYADYENGPSGTDRATYKLMAAYEPPHAVLGVEALDCVNHRATGGNVEPAGLSAFARWSRDPAFGAFARVDLWRPDRRAANRVDSRLWIAGLDWQPMKDVHVMPNFELQEYLARGAAVAPPWHDLQARITLYYRYSRPQS
jgi:hypothetical protein